jgi:hypothetical protein
MFIAHHKGITSKSNMASVMTATAGPRFPLKTRCNINRAGQVATTIMPAQTVAAKNGFNTQRDSASKPKIQHTASVLRVMLFRMI